MVATARAPEQAFLGEDLIILQSMAHCGRANARPIAKEHVLVAEAGGGHRAGREAIEFILAAQGQLEAAFAPYLEQQ